MTNEEKILIKMLSLFSFATAMANIFLGLFLFSLGGFQTVVTFFTVYFLFLIAAYIASGWTLQKISSSQGIQIGLLLYSLSYFLLVVLGKESVHFLPLLSVIFGLSSGTFWSGNNLSQYIHTNEDSRNEYFSKMNSLTSIGSTLGPIIGGGIIAFFAAYHLPLIGYMSVFGFVGTLLFFVALLAGRLPLHEKIEFSPKQLFKQATKKWYLILFQQFSLGLYDSAFATLSGILVFLIVKNELQVGIINAACTIAYALISFYSATILKKYKNSYAFGMISVSIGLFLFGYFHNYASLAILIGLIYGLSPFISNPILKVLLDTIDEIPSTWQEKYHFLIERDTFLGIGRVFSYTILLFFLSSRNSIEVVTLWILCIAIIPTLVSGIQYLLYNIEKE